MPGEGYPRCYGQRNEARPLVRAHTTVSDRSELSKDVLTGEQGSLGLPMKPNGEWAVPPDGRDRNLPFWILCHEVAALLSVIAHPKMLRAVFSAAATTWSML